MRARFIAIDWSGRKSGERRTIWYAEVRGGHLTRLEDGRSRDEVVQHLIDEASRSPHLIAGLDFAFSFPRWFVEDADASSADDVWALAEQRGESWLQTCEDPFWGREGRGRPDLVEHNRRTEIDASTADSKPKSVFQINGAGAVGTGSIRGMPYLRVLRSAGFSIWPFHEAKLPLIVEIYPRLLTGPVVKSRQADREAYLASGFPEIDGHFRSLAACSEDAFDAAVSAVIMSRHASELDGLSQSLDPVDLLEGQIWWPQGAPAPTSTAQSPSRVGGCPFCIPAVANVVSRSNHAFAIRDQYPVSRGHTLVIPKIHRTRISDLPGDVIEDVWRLVSEVREELESEFHPDGFNIGVNDGEAAGQTMPHVHVHVIPRYSGDVADPRGGIRWVIPDEAPYWDR